MVLADVCIIILYFIILNDMPDSKRVKVPSYFHCADIVNNNPHTVYFSVSGQSGSLVISSSEVCYDYIPRDPYKSRINHFNCVQGDQLTRGLQT